MASQKAGTDLASIQKCNTRVQFLNIGAKILQSERLADGNLVEIYQVQAEKGSVVRAIMHGILDCSTGFMWELVGTPIEASVNKEQFITIKVTYGQNDVILKAEFI